MLDEIKTSNQTISSNSSAFNVNLESVRLFASKVKFSDHTTMEVENIEPIAYNKDTLLYFVNYSNKKGWLVVSADKRTEPILASSESGKIEKNNLGPSAIWYSDVTEKIYALKQSDNRDSTSVHFSMWRNFEKLAFKQQQKKYNKRLKSIPDHLKPDNQGSFLIDTEVIIVSDNKLGPLIKTKWGQASPWNQCVPFDYETNKRCLTGCVAVAGAQLIYYFHHKENKPAVFYSQGECIGWVKDGNWFNRGADFGFHFSNPTIDVWKKMPLKQNHFPLNTPGSEFVSLLMGYVGSEIDTKYTLKASGAKMENLVRFFKKRGINSSNTDYNEQSVRNSLDKKLPVIVGAYRTKERPKLLGIPLFWWKYNNGHAWIIDGYTEKLTKYIYTYETRPIDPITGAYQEYYDDAIPVLTEDADSTAIAELEEEKRKRREKRKFPTHQTMKESRSLFWKMNFGWDGKADQADYLTGNNSNWQVGSYKYEYKKNIIHKFTF